MYQIKINYSYILSLFLFITKITALINDNLIKISLNEDINFTE